MTFSFLFKQFSSKVKPIGKASPVVQQRPVSPKPAKRSAAIAPAKRPSPAPISSSPQASVSVLSVEPSPKKKRKVSESSQDSQGSADTTEKVTERRYL